jgi:type II pantothenate kinase
MTMNLIGASICDEELIVQGEARDIQLPNTEHVSQISVDVSETPLQLVMKKSLN